MTSPFDDIRQLLGDLPGPSPAASGGEGRLGEIAGWLSAWSGKSPPSVTRPVIAIYAGGHGVATHLPEAPPTRGMLEAIAAGIAPVSQAAQGVGAGLDAFDLALERPVPDITQRAAMSEKEAAATMAFGMEALAKQPDLLILGEIGHGSEVAAAALCCGLFGGDADEWSEHPGPVAEAVGRAEREGASEPLELLRQLGGREIAAQAGAIVAARMQKVPVLIDSFGGCAAAAVLATLRPDAADHCMAGQVSSAKGHREVLKRLGLRPLVDLGLREGAGAGSAASIGIVRLACATLPG